MKPYIHAQSSQRIHGGTPEDYLKIHDWFDQTKSHFGDNRHRAILHTSFGIFLCEQMFGHNITNSDGKNVSVREFGEQHVMEDMKCIPNISDYLSAMEYQPWMHGEGIAPSNVKVEEFEQESAVIDGARDLLPRTLDDVGPEPKAPVILHGPTRYDGNMGGVGYRSRSRSRPRPTRYD